MKRREFFGGLAALVGSVAGAPPFLAEGKPILKDHSKVRADYKVRLLRGTAISGSDALCGNEEQVCWGDEP